MPTNETENIPPHQHSPYNRECHYTISAGLHPCTCDACPTCGKPNAGIAGVNETECYDCANAPRCECGERIPEFLPGSTKCGGCLTLAMVACAWCGEAKPDVKVRDVGQHVLLCADCETTCTGRG